MFTSLLAPEINYDEEFESEELNEEDKSKHAQLYQITIFGNEHHIAMGEQKTHPKNENIIYYVVYMIYKEKVVSKIGIYEFDNRKTGKIDEDSIFEQTPLLLHPKHKRPPFYLETFKIEPSGFDDETTGDASENIENDEHKEGTAKSSHVSIVLTDDKLALEPGKSNDYLYDAFKIMSVTSEGKTIISNKSKYLLQDFGHSLISYLMKNISNDELKQALKLQSDQFYSDLIVRKTDKDGKVTSGFGFHKKLMSYKTKKGIYEYSLNAPLLMSLELLFNVKFIIVKTEYNNETDKSEYTIDTIGLIPGYNHDIDIIQEYNDDKGKSSDLKTKAKLNYLMKTFKEYNPEKVIFLSKENDTYEVLTYNNKVMIDIQELDQKFLSLFFEKVDQQDHYYSYDTQFSLLRSLYNSKKTTNVETLEEDEQDEKVEEEVTMEQQATEQPNEPESVNEQEVPPAPVEQNTKENKQSGLSLPPPTPTKNDDKQYEKQPPSSTASSSSKLTLKERVKALKKKQQRTKSLRIKTPAETTSSE